MWYRIFSHSELEITPSALAELLHARGYQFAPHFRGDEFGWTSGELQFSQGSPISLYRYLTKHDKIRDELNTHAAVLETMDYSPHHTALMQHVIQTRQLVAIRKPIDHADEITLDGILDAITRLYATATEGMIQIDSRGWFNPLGDILIQEY